MKRRQWGHKRKYLEADAALAEAGVDARYAVTCIVLMDSPHHPHWIADLRRGLAALARHFGLVGKDKSDYRYVSPKNSASTSIGGSSKGTRRLHGPCRA